MRHLEIDVVANLSQSLYGSFERTVVWRHVVINHGEDNRSGAQLQIRLNLTHVRVADNDVESPVFLAVSMRLVSGIDDRSLQGRFKPDLLLKKIGSLRDLEGNVRMGQTRRF